MFEVLGLEEELTFAIKGMVPPFQVYQWAVNKCFLEGTQGPAVESLKRCFTLFGNGKNNRLTPEWDALIHLTEDSPVEINELAPDDDRSLAGWANIILKK